MAFNSSSNPSILDLFEQEAYPPEPMLHRPVTPRVEITEVEVHGQIRKRFKFTEEDLLRYFKGEDPYATPHGPSIPQYTGKDIVSRLCQHAELAVELGKHLRPKDLVNLYSVSKVFHATVNAYMLSSVRTWVSYKAPEAAQVFPFTMYRKHLIPDPAGRTWSEVRDEDLSKPQEDTRSVPGLRYLQLVVGRDRYCREISAILARNGHRTPATMHSTLLKLWLLMDVSTSSQRAALLRNVEIWTDIDLYNAQLLFVKLGMYCNDPVYGPSSYEMLHLILGQKGLYPLWQFLFAKKFTRLPEFLELKMRYDTVITPDHWGINYYGCTMHGVPYEEVGTSHLEGWGKGDKHLLRPDELVPIEAVTRGLELDKHITHMMMWGHIDFQTGENLVPTEEEMYLSDEETVLNNVDTTYHWKKKHAMKKRFDTLTHEEQQAIIAEDEDNKLRAMAWCGEDIDDYSSSEGDDDEYSLDDEINRGFVSRPARTRTVPQADDASGWVDFVNSVLRGLTIDLNEDQRLRAQAWQSYQTVEYEGDWDWMAWLEEQQQVDKYDEGAEDARSDESANDSEDTEESDV